MTDPAGAASYFFTNRKHAGSNQRYSFYNPKPAGTVRIVIVGESVAEGYPEPPNLASSAFLAEMLKDAWPSRKVEVLNLGTTAVASFPVLEIMTETLNYAPDLVVIYTGHNEFFGAYGVASIDWAGGKPWMLKTTRFLHSLAIAQALEKVLPAPAAQKSETLMEMMVGQNYIAPDDWRRRAAADNLEYNVGQMLDRCQARGVPALVCTPPSNERDLAPIGREKTDRLDSAKAAEFSRRLASGMELTRRDPTNAIEQLNAALTLCPEDARAHFYLGKALFALGRYPEASKHFVQARDLDTMPWRAPTLSQQAILRVARQHGAAVCDLEKVFRESSPGGAIGWELMDDHVHPTLQGQALVARAILECLMRMREPLNLSPEALARVSDWKVYARRLGDNPFDRYSVAHTLRTVFDVPFMHEANPEAFARFDALASGIENEYPAEIRAVMGEWQTATLQGDAKPPLTAMVARVLMRQNKMAEALELWHITQKSVPPYTSWHMENAFFALACQEKLHGSLTDEEKALALEEIKQGRFLLQHGDDAEFGFVDHYAGRLHQLRGEFAEAIPYLQASRKKLNGLDLMAAEQALIVSYVKTGQFEKATLIADNGVEHSGPYAGFYRQMAAELSALNQTNQSDGAEPKSGSK
jgi:tetratricopeptide (TPR) repeat protein